MFKFLADNKDAFESLSQIFTVFALILGGYWTYYGFLKNRLKYPRADLSHKYSVIKLSEDKTLISLELIINNNGNVLIPLSEIRTKLYQIKPFPKRMDMIKESLDCDNELNWLTLGNCNKKMNWNKGEAEIEPGELQSFNFEFIVDSYIEIVKIYSYLQNVRKNDIDIGWDKTSVISLTINM